MIALEKCASIPTPAPKSLPLKNSRKEHMIVFNCDGTVERKVDICDCDGCFADNLGDCVYKNVNNDEGDDDEDNGEDEDDKDDKHSDNNQIKISGRVKT